MASINLQGDTSGAITISAPSVAGSNTLTLPATTQTLATQNALGVRNLIINGDMKIAQRGTSASGLVNYANYNTLDRWKFATNIGTWTMSQDSDIPSGQGFVKSLKLACTTVDTTLGSTDYCFVEQKIEAQNLQHLKFGTSSAETLTLSFWIKSNKTGIVNTELRQDDATRSISRAATINAADTWEKKTFTIEGDTSGVINNDNGQGFRLLFHLDAGSDYTSTALQTTWDTDIPAGSAYNNVHLADSTSNYINITGIQLEIGTEATPFEHRPYDMELARCQRYYYHLTDDTSSQHVGTGYWGTTVSARGAVHFPVPMRTSPSMSYSSGSHFKALIPGVSFVISTAITIYKNSEESSLLALTVSGGTTGQGTHLEFYSSPVTTTYLGFSAEL